MSIHPGTVSQILWHFTGGPLWNAERNCQEKEPKPSPQAYKALLGILKSKLVRLGSYKELVKIHFPENSRLDRATGKTRKIKERFEEMSSEPVNCLADIPAIHLGYHAQRYGRFAIGFHRKAAIKHSFNPVLYALHNTGFLQSIFDGFIRLEMIDTSVINHATASIDSKIDDVEWPKGQDVRLNITHEVVDLYAMEHLIDAAFATAKKSFSRFLAFIKTFHESEFETIYCEREWRSVREFEFTFPEVAMIVIPKKAGRGAFFEEFVGNEARKLKIPRSVPIVPWEDFIEH